MSLFSLIRRHITPLLVFCCFACFGGKQAQAQSTTIINLPVENCAQPLSQLCSPPYSTAVNVAQTGPITVDFAASSGHCSNIQVSVFLDGVLVTTSAFLGPGQSTGPITMLAVSAGSHTIALQANGEIGGCNTGTLAAWTGTLAITVGPQPTFQTGDVFIGIASGSTVANSPNGQILWYRRDGTPVGTLDTGQLFTEVAGMAFDAAGDLFATVFSAANVVKFDHNGNLLGTFGSGYGTPYATDGTANHPESIVFDSSGDAYVGQADGTRQVRKFDSAGNFLAAFSPVTQFRGTDWIELAGDEKTLYYTSEGTEVKRFDVSTNTQLSDFATGFPDVNAAYALRILSNGGVLVADTDRVLRLDSSGNVVQTYLATSLEPGFTCVTTPTPTPCPVIFALSLDPDGKSFWTADLLAGTVWKVDIATGAIDLTINTGSSLVGGVLIFGEPTQTKQSVSLHLSPGTASSATAPFLTNGDPTNAASHAMKLTTNVQNPNGIDVLLTANYEPTELTADPTNAVGLADGICEVSQLGGILANVDETKDFDCRLAKGGFVYQTLGNGDVVVPHCAPYHNNMCVWYRATTTATAQDQVPPGSPICSSTQGPPCYDYIGPVLEEMGWNTNVTLAPSSTEWTAGWDKTNERLYDRHGDDPDIAFKFDITDYFNVNCTIFCVIPNDQSGGGHTKHTNDWVWADIPNPPAGTPADTVERFVPVPGVSPFPYLKGFPMLVTFELENESAETSDGTALTFPHTVNVGTLDPNGIPIPVQFPKGASTTFTYNKKLKLYSIFLSSAPYTLLSDGTSNTVYTLQIGSDLFPPISVPFKMCTLLQVLTGKCP